PAHYWPYTLNARHFAGRGLGATMSVIKTYPRNKADRRIIAAALTVAAAIGASAMPAPAVTYTWTGANNSGNPKDLWTQGNNWSGNTAPVSAITAAIIMNGATRQTNEMNANFTVNSLTFNNGGFDVQPSGTVTLFLAGTNPAVTSSSGNNLLEVNLTLQAAPAFTATAGV